MSNLVQRTIFGALYVAVVVAAILVHPLLFAGVFLIVSTLAVRECHILMQDDRHIRWIGMVLNVLLFAHTTLLFVLRDSAWLGHWWHDVFLATGIAYAGVIIGALISELLLAGQSQPAKHWGDLLAGQVMVALPFSCMLMLQAFDKWILLAVFVLLWMNDTAAYCVGSLTAKLPQGNHKMAPYVSPKKSWEGLFGGALFTIATTLLLAHLGWLDSLTAGATDTAATLIVIGFGVLAVVGGTFGDLMESLMKRSIGVKDSGAFLPGHGGVLDRFDSLLLAAPLLLLYYYIVTMA